MASASKNRTSIMQKNIKLKQQSIDIQKQRLDIAEQSLKYSKKQSRIATIQVKTDGLTDLAKKCWRCNRASCFNRCNLMLINFNSLKLA